MISQLLRLGQVPHDLVIGYDCQTTQAVQSGLPHSGFIVTWQFLPICFDAGMQIN